MICLLGYILIVLVECDTSKGEPYCDDDGMDRLCKLTEFETILIGTNCKFILFSTTVNVAVSVVDTEDLN